MVSKNLSAVHLLFCEALPTGEAGFLVNPHEHWCNPGGVPYLALPVRMTVAAQAG